MGLYTIFSISQGGMDIHRCPTVYSGGFSYAVSNNIISYVAVSTSGPFHRNITASVGSSWIC